jgi:hypothetical protein
MHGPRFDGTYLEGQVRSPGSGNDHHHSLVVIRASGLDVFQARQYFAGLEGLAREARTTRDPRVIRVALAVLAMQPANSQELGPYVR